MSGETVQGCNSNPAKQLEGYLLGILQAALPSVSSLLHMPADLQFNVFLNPVYALQQARRT